ncbi:type I restriction endonuclease subunit R [Spirosoma validum]|uniref:type I site-specific deoxyribonuclease n=1 Tax=Spirosoma validum TaxID=2771355 RepID=A0A927AZ98_9BACT|nr:type I restriction endonuclease [Spirosoma validum]MBD2752505.1 type I restriction endonuclease subunit R [Spirosoma validum]
MAFNENTRVKIPAILHLNRLGYRYLSLSNANHDESTNIFTDIFHESLYQINPGVDAQDVSRLLEKIKLALDNDDLGQEFYKMLLATSDIKLVDFKNFDTNDFRVVTELTCKNGDDEFRPDITLLINGMPLAFIEVKKPNNREGVLAERDRINKRFSNPKFKRFINISQLLVFSNNMEYDTESIVPIQGAFYATTSTQQVNFNCFREELSNELAHQLALEDDTLENVILKDNNLAAIKHSPEFITNKNPNNPTNRILTSLFSQERLKMILKYGIVYVHEEKGLEKHVMRYPQLFATKAIEKTIDEGKRKGIIWHTQGSGKTALSFYNVAYLTDYFQRKGVIPKFYFIVDRIDLMNQAKREFSSRGLVVHTVNSKEELVSDYRTPKAIHNLTGQPEITVVNIQKFKEETSVLKSSDYAIDIQRVYFVDEAHRGYKLEGSFLANLSTSDRKAIVIALTGTPLIGKDARSKDIFGDYIHKYYYNASIADGYTLKLIREGIETNYKIQLEQALKEVEILKGDVDRRLIYAHPTFVEPMLDYIILDFTESRKRLGDQTIGGMVVCDSADQAEKLYELFQSKYVATATVVPLSTSSSIALAADQQGIYTTTAKSKKALSAALILHDAGTKDDRRQQVEEFKEGRIDLLFVYNMLLTGFDAKRLKKLYLGRVVKDHNLLQTLTRVNRPYKSFQYGYVVDFADIRNEFDKTNKDYFDELQQELGDEMQTYSNLFKTKEEIEAEIKDIKETLFPYDLRNSEIFSQQISEIEDRSTMLAIKKVLANARNLYNLIRQFDHVELLAKIDFKKLNELFRVAADHLDLVNQKLSLQNSTDTTNLLNIALENVLFMFTKVSENELVLADQLKDTLRKTREALRSNFDQDDPDFITLYEELKRLFKKKNLDEITQADMIQNIGSLRVIYERVNELNRKNNLLRAKYENDTKYARVHKRILERGDITKRESEIHETLLIIKQQTDDQVLKNSRLLNNEGFFTQMMQQEVVKGFQQTSVKLAPDSARYINGLVVREYVNEYQGNYRW